MKIPLICTKKENVSYNKKLDKLYHQGMMNKDKYNEIKNSSNPINGLSDYYYFITLKQVIISLVIFIAIVLTTFFMFSTVISSMSNASEYNEICEVSSEYTEGIDCNKTFATDSDIKTLKTLINNEIEMPLSNSDYEKKIEELKTNYKTIIGYTDENINEKYTSIKTDNLEEAYNAFNDLYNTDLKSEQETLNELVGEAKDLGIEVSVSKEDTLKTKQTKYKTAVDKEEKRVAAEKKAKEEAEANAKAEEEAQAEANQQTINVPEKDEETKVNTDTNSSNTPEENKEESPEVNNDYCYPTYDDAYEAGLNVFLNGSFIESDGIGKFEVNSNNCPIYYGTNGTYDINGNKI